MISTIVPVTGDVNVSTEAVGECIKVTRGFSSKTYHNICEGTQNVVQSGSFDLVINYLMAGLLFSLLGALLFCFYKIATE